MAKLGKSRVGFDNGARAHGELAEAQLKAVDRAVGAQVRKHRMALGLSQEAVARTMGLAFQQLQKYEQGTNRISGSRLYQLAMILQVDVPTFFATVDIGEVAVPAPNARALEADDLPDGVMKKSRTVELVRAYYDILDEKRRDAAFQLLKTLGSAGKSF